MKTRYSNVFIALALLALSTLNIQLSTAFAQGTAFTYQGRLIDNGAPANGSYDLKFALYTTNLNGSAFAGPVTNSATAVSNGLFTVTLDFGGVFDGGPRWLEIGVSSNKLNSFSTLNPRQPLTPAPYAIFANTASNVSGTVSSASIVGSYDNAVMLNNANNSFTGAFSGSGANVTDVDAVTLNGMAASNFWQTAGNAGTSPAKGNFLGTTDNQPLELKVNGDRALRLEPSPGTAAPNVIGGSSANFVSSGVVGATIAGGGTTNYSGTANTNSVIADFGTIGGGLGNTAVNSYSTVAGGIDNSAGGGNSVVGGGGYNYAGNNYAAVVGGYANIATGAGSFIGGGGSDGVNYLGNEASGDGSVIGGGLNNTAASLYSTVAGGSGNQVQPFGEGSIVGGGEGNTIEESFDDSTISGGYYNDIQGDGATIGGGQNNLADNNNSTVGGGFGNTASGISATVAGGGQQFSADITKVKPRDGGGGNGNTASGDYSSIGGGWGNTAAYEDATISGGDQNSVGGYASTVSGGENNSANNSYSAIAGGQANTANGNSSFVGGGDGNTANSDYSVVGGGGNDFVGGNNGTVVGGNNNQDWGYADFIGGGQNNSSYGGNVSAIAGGENNFSGGSDATIGGGNGNTVGDANTTIGGGANNIATNMSSVVCGGTNNISGGYAATAAGGSDNQALGDYSFAAGWAAQATNNGAFVWSDASGYPFTSTTTNEFSARATGGVRFVTAVDDSGNPAAGVSLAGGGGSWSSLSDRNAKNNFAPLNSQTVLARVASLPMSTWSYKTEPGVRHVGPMAQDFYAAFGVGEDNRHITEVDEGGVALAAIQGLNQKLNEKDAEIQQLQQSIAQLKAMVNELAAQQKGNAQ